MPEQIPPGKNTEQFVIQHVYTKDISFETPNSPHIFKETWQPQLHVEITNEVSNLEDTVFDITLKVTATVKNAEKTAFLVEVHQAGIFNIAGFDEPRLKQLLNTTCLHVLFPYARTAISNLVLNGGFHPLLLPQPNFEVMYAQRLNQTSKPN